MQNRDIKQHGNKKRGKKKEKAKFLNVNNEGYSQYLCSFFEIYSYILFCPNLNLYNDNAPIKLFFQITFGPYAEAYLEPCQKYKVEHFTKINNVVFLK